MNSDVIKAMKTVRRCHTLRVSDEEANSHSKLDVELFNNRASC